MDDMFEVVCKYLYAIIGDVVLVECIDIYVDCGLEILFFLIKYSLLYM